MSSQGPGSGLSRTRSIRNAHPPNVDTTRRDGTPSSSVSSPSRLPVKGSMGPPPLPVSSGLQRTSSMRAPASTAAAAAAAAKKPRPISSVLTRSASVRQARQPSPIDPSGRAPTTTRARAPTTTTTGRPPSASSGVAGSQAMSASPASTTISRTTTSSSGPTTKPRAATGPGHARTKSSATALAGATTLRPPSQTEQQRDTTRERVRFPPTTSATSSEPKVLHRRQGSTPVKSTTTIQGVSGPTRTAGAPGKRSQTISDPSNNSSTTASDAPRLRPAFSAFQQHYSPAKSLAPKPLTSSFLAPPSPSKLPANVAASAETGRLQTELLQLHLIHRDAAAVNSEWNVSARRQLGARFQALVDRADEVRARESRTVETANTRALRAWIQKGQGKGGRNAVGLGLLEDKVRGLDAVLSTLWAMGEQPGGRYARLVRHFDRWAEQVTGIMAARRDGGNITIPRDQEIVFVGELEAGWMDECESLARRLDECRRTLRDIGDAPDEEPAEGNGQEGDENGRSSLAVILAACRAMVRDMLSQLDLMELVARDAVEQEKVWVRKMNADYLEMENESPRAGAIWRTL